MGSFVRHKLGSMDPVADYQRQFGWRPWGRILDLLPPLGGLNVLDLGCGIGDLAAELTNRGARVTGFDINQQFVDFALDRHIENGKFHCCDLRSLPASGEQADLIWSSFAAAYFTDFSDVLASWGTRLRPGGWITLTEIDNLFGHEPVKARTRALLNAYSQDALQAGRYDFFMGRKLRGYLEECGFQILTFVTLEDQELSFQGPASPEVVNAWSRRLAGMGLLQDYCGAEFPSLREDFLGCLERPDHDSTAKVCCCIAQKR